MTLNWGAYPAHADQRVRALHWRQSSPFIEPHATCYLPHGNGRSYGDSCLNDEGWLINTLSLNHFLAFDETTGILRCESGVLLADILQCIVPKGWFLPVLPGTKFVSLGGAIANDVHGKNHHLTGTFGCHVLQLELLRSDGARIRCSPQSHAELFQATIGGLGLTGIVLWADIQLQPLSSAFLDVDTLPFCGLSEFYDLVKQTADNAAYTVAWLDCQAKGRRFGRGLFMAARPSVVLNTSATSSSRSRTLPCYLPAMTINRYSMSWFNALYYWRGARKGSQVIHYDDYFFPLDSLLEWRRVYGRPGFLQYQFVLPWGSEAYLEQILSHITASGLGSCLSVLKTFGSNLSPGLLSFPIPGVTLALDFPNRPAVFTLLNVLDDLVMTAGGRVYIAKDARMSAQAFQCYYPQFKNFSRWVDPHFSSSFWRRVTKGVL